MADPEHVEIVKQGALAVRECRRHYGRVRLDLGGANLSEVNLSGADLDEANLSGANLSEANLSRASLGDADLSEANLSRADLGDADLRRADLSWANLSGANLSEAYLSSANLSGADLSGARLTLADLTLADLGGANLNGANLNGANLNRMVCNGTVFADVDLSKARGLGSVEHRGPSTIGIDTLLRSGGDIPESFLEGCGVPQNWLDYLPSLLGQPIQFYSCFISFTETDDQFSERLYNDLKGAGVRCWRWKEDAKWGRTLWGEVDGAIRLSDKLVMICSKDSLISPAVIREIERALQREDELKRRGEEGEVLFPIRIDDYVFEGWEHHRKADVVAKYVGDFRNWTDPKPYDKSLKRLIRDLQAGT